MFQLVFNVVFTLPFHVAIRTLPFHKTSVIQHEKVPLKLPFINCISIDFLFFFKEISLHVLQLMLLMKESVLSLKEKNSK